jgi:hypothetical protein
LSYGPNYFSAGKLQRLYYDRLSVESNIDPGFVEGSNFVRAANLVANVHVPLMTAMGHLHFRGQGDHLGSRQTLVTKLQASMRMR